MPYATKTRDQILREWQRDFRFRVPEADVGQGTQPFIDGSTVADALMPVYANSVAIEAATKLAGSTRTKLDEDGEALGITRAGAGNAQGYVIADCGPSGANVVAGMVLTYDKARTRYQCTVTSAVVAGSLVPVEALDGGPLGNRKPGDVLEWESPTPGLRARALVFENSDGTGLTGGSVAQDDDSYRRVLLSAKADPPAGGNAATYTQQMTAIPGIGMQAAFCYPAVAGPGTVGVAFTMRPQRPGASRLPNGAQLSAVESGLLVNEDDGVLMHSVLDQPIALRIAVTWPGATSGFTDAAPWPEKGGSVAVTGVTDARHIVVTRTGAAGTPVAGKTCAFYDELAGVFRKKRIEVVSGANPYTLTFAAGADQDAAYVPIVGRVVSAASPFADSLIAPLLSYVDGFGPGEIVALFSDEGSRQRRFPTPSADSWPSVLNAGVLDPIDDLVDSATVMAPAVPLATTVGTPGVSVYLMRLADLAVVKE